MGKKKNKVQVFVLKPWCWYCEREFEDEKVLLQHQKSKHFKCQLCPRKLNTAGGLMVHSQQVHKCEPEPLTNTLPGRDGYDIEIFGMEGVPSNALQEWKARKEAEAGTAALAAAAAKNRPRVAYTVIPEADLQAALAQHKALMAKREVEVKSVQPAPAVVPQGVAPPPMPMPSYLPPFPPPQMSQYPPGLPPNMSMPPFPPAPGPGFAPNGGPPGIGMPMGNSPVPPLAGAPTGPRSAELAGPPTGTPTGPAGGPSDGAALSLENQQQREQVSQADVEPVEVLPPKDGVLWPDADHTPAQKRAQQPRYRYTSPTPDGANGAETGAGFGGVGRKRKAAADFI